MVDAGKLVHVKVEIEDFETNFQQFESEHKTFVGIFKGSLDPITKVNWCPDCVAVEEPLKNTFFPLAQEKKIAILEVSVGKKEEYGVFFFKFYENRMFLAGKHKHIL